jgi:hypothetical protein
MQKSTRRLTCVRCRILSSIMQISELHRQGSWTIFLSFSLFTDTQTILLCPLLLLIDAPSLSMNLPSAKQMFPIVLHTTLVTTCKVYIDTLKFLWGNRLNVLWNIFVNFFIHINSLFNSYPQIKVTCGEVCKACCPQTTRHKSAPECFPVSVCECKASEGFLTRMFKPSSGLFLFPFSDHLGFQSPPHPLPLQFPVMTQSNLFVLFSASHHILNGNILKCVLEIFFYILHIMNFWSQGSIVSVVTGTQAGKSSFISCWGCYLTFTFTFTEPHKLSLQCVLSVNLEWMTDNLLLCGHYSSKV